MELRLCQSVLRLGLQLRSQPQHRNLQPSWLSALSYFDIGEVTDMGEFGRDYALVTHNPIATRATVKRKGSFNEGTMDMKVGLDTDDSGQIVAKAASESDNDYSFKVTLQSGDVYYFQAQVMSYKINVGSVDNITTASIKLELTSAPDGTGIVEVLGSWFVKLNAPDHDRGLMAAQLIGQLIYGVGSVLWIMAGHRADPTMKGDLCLTLLRLQS
jgi:hypothetical protein